jgi:hypothetical protein
MRSVEELVPVLNERCLENNASPNVFPSVCLNVCHVGDLWPSGKR